MKRLSRTSLWYITPGSRFIPVKTAHVRDRIMELIVQNDIQEGAMDAQAAYIVDEAALFKPGHEEGDFGAGDAGHLGEGLLIDLRPDDLGPILFPEAGQQEKRPGQPLFDRIEELI